MSSFPFNFKQDIDNFTESSIDNFQYIENIYCPVDKNLSNKKNVVKQYFKSVLDGSNHHLLMKYATSSKSLDNNILIPYINDWNDNISIDNLVIINNPNDVKYLSKYNIKKAPVFQNVVKNSVIATTDNNDWKNQRYRMNKIFLTDNLVKVFNKSKLRANYCVKYLAEKSNSYKNDIDMNDFFLNETQAQLQSALFGFDNDYIESNNKKIRNVFIGRNTEYSNEFVQMTMKQCEKSDSELSQFLNNLEDKNRVGSNILLFAFAGHDTTGHTLTWLLYELCKNPIYKKKLINEVDKFWKNNREVTYESLNELSFMSKCIFETLRLWPTLANGTYRELEEDEEITGLDGHMVTLKKGTYVQIFNWIKHRNPNLWGDTVTIFDPEREFKDCEIWDKPFNLYHTESDRFSPFTYSPRNCLGKNFAHMEMRLILLNIFKSHDFILTKEQSKVKEEELSCNYFTMGPKDLKNKNVIAMYFNVFRRKPNL